MNELKSCPFCGSSNVRYSYEWYDETGSEPFDVVCDGCGASAPPDVWNERAIGEAEQIYRMYIEDTSALLARIEELKKSGGGKGGKRQARHV